MNDSSVTKHVTGDIAKDFVAAVNASGANLHSAVLSHAAKRMATHLFIEAEFLKRQFLAGACFLRGFLARVGFSHRPPDQCKN